MPPSLRPASDDRRAPKDEGPLLPELEMLEPGAPPRRRDASGKAAPVRRRAGTYRAPTLRERLATFLDPRRVFDKLRLRRLYRDVRPFEKLAYLKHYQREASSAAATHGLDLVEFAADARRRQRE